MIQVYINDPNDPHYVIKLMMPVVPRIGETISIDFTELYKVTGVKYYISKGYFTSKEHKEFNNSYTTSVVIFVDKIE